MDFDKKMMDSVFSRAGMNEARASINKFLEMSRSDPQSQVMMAMFRDIFMFKDMVYSYVSKYDSKIKELERQVEELKYQSNEDD